MGAAQFPVILTYHSISEGDPPLQISPSLFAEQMEWLQANVRVASLGEVVGRLDGAQAAARTNRSAHLRRWLFRLLLLGSAGAATAEVSGYDLRADGSLRWRESLRPDRLAGSVRNPCSTGTRLAALAKEGFSFGAHSITHPALPALSAEEAKHEIAGSKTELEEHTGQRVEFFAYPYGRWSPAVRAMVQEEYRGACSTGAGVVEPDADPFALPRVDVHYLRRPAAFRMLFTAPFLAYVATRRFIRRIRHQPEGFYARV